MVKTKITFATLMVVLLSGCLCNQPAKYSITNISEGVMEYQSDAHGGFSFNINSSFNLNQESSQDTDFITALEFNNQADDEMVSIGVFPELMNQNGSWTREACNREMISERLNAEQGVNITNITLTENISMGSLKLCQAEASMRQEGVELPFVMSFAECKDSLPVYVFAVGNNSKSNVEIVLESFKC